MFKFILNYQDHILSKYLCHWPLKFKTAIEEAYSLIYVFYTFGTLSMFQLENGRKFDNKIIEELKTIWSVLKIVHGKLRHSQNQVSVKHSNVEAGCLDDNKSKNWSEGLRLSVSRNKKNNTVFFLVKHKLNLKRRLVENLCIIYFVTITRFCSFKLNNRKRFTKRSKFMSF